MYLSTHTFFLPNEHFTYFTTFCVNEEIHFCTADRPGPRHWPLIPSGLLIRIQSSPCHGVTSLSGQESKPCFKPLLAKVIQNQDSIGKGFSPARLPLPPPHFPPSTSETNWKSRLTPVLLADGLNQRLPPTPLLGLINLLGLLIELKETLLTISFVYYNSGMARWERCTGQDMGYRTSRPLRLSILSSLHLSTNLDAPWTSSFYLCYGGFIIHCCSVVTESCLTLSPLHGL